MGVGRIRFRGRNGGRLCQERHLELGAFEGCVGVILINDTLLSFSYAMRGYISICVSNRLVININFIKQLLFLGKT